MISSKILVDRSKQLLQIHKQKFKNEKGVIDRYERQINYYKDKLYKNELIIQTNLENVENIMIVAHADDETIFGMNELHNGEKWLLIICTNSIDGRIGVTRKDIPGVIQMSKDYNFNLAVIQHFDYNEYDITNARFDKKVYDYLKKYLLKQEWQKIITHNKDGEYSHDQHILVHRIVSTILFNNNVNYKDFKVFDFSNDILNDISLPEKNLRKYYWLGGGILEFNSHKVCTKNEEPMNYDMTNVLCE
jgi:hypothetical protein